MALIPSVLAQIAQIDNRWNISGDIVIEGVSLVTNYRGQFAQEIRTNGLDSLIKKLADKNRAAEAKTSKSKVVEASSAAN